MSVVLGHHLDNILTCLYIVGWCFRKDWNSTAHYNCTRHLLISSYTDWYKWHSHGSVYTNESIYVIIESLQTCCCLMAQKSPRCRVIKHNLSKSWSAFMNAPLYMWSYYFSRKPWVCPFLLVSMKTFTFILKSLTRIYLNNLHNTIWSSYMINSYLRVTSLITHKCYVHASRLAVVNLREIHLAFFFLIFLFKLAPLNI